MTKPKKVPASKPVKAPKKSAKPEVAVNAAPLVDEASDDCDDQAAMLKLGYPAIEPELKVKLTRQLHGKLAQLAKDEGVTLDALVQELLAEGATLRAFEVIESKAAIRGNAGNQNPQPQHRGGGFQGNNSSQQHRGNHGHAPHQRSGASRHNNNGRRNNPPNSAWMEDRATFLEYVRNQERDRR